MGATFNRLKTWVSEKLSASDLNAEIDNILDNLDPSGMGDYSLNAAQMQTQVDPGDVGSESLATSLEGEVTRIRHQIAELKGESYWYSTPDTTLAAVNAQLVAAADTATQLVSGALKSTSKQSQFLVPSGTGNGDSFTLAATATDFVYKLGGTTYTLTTDVTQANTASAPLTNNTADVNDAGILDQAWTKHYGSYGGAIEIDNIGAEISVLNQTRQTFRVGNEYFRAMIDTSRFQLRNLERGIFFDENGDGIPAGVITNNDTITLMSTNYVFVDTAGALSLTTNEPVYSSEEPGSPASGDYWYDMANAAWKLYDGATFNTAVVIYLGMVITDENDDTVAARSEDFAHTYYDYNNVKLDRYWNSSSQLQLHGDARIGVYGNIFEYRSLSLFDSIHWTSADLDTGSIAADTLYFYYITETGVAKMSLQAPIDLTVTRGGLYHPHETWRAVGQAYWTSTSEAGNIISYNDDNYENVSTLQEVDTNALILTYFASPLVKHRREVLTDSTLGPYSSFRVPFYMSLTVPSGATLGHNDGDEDHVVLHIGTQYTRKSLMMAVSSHQYGQFSDSVTPVDLTATSDAGSLYSPSGTAQMEPLAVAWGRGDQTTAGTWASTLNFFKAGHNLDICRVYKGASTGLYSHATTALNDVTDVSANFAPNLGKRLEITFESINGSSIQSGEMRGDRTTGSDTTTGGQFILQNTNAAGSPTLTYYTTINAVGSSSSTLGIAVPPSVFRVTHDDVSQAAPIYLVAKSFSTSDTISINYSKMVVRELPHNGGTV